MNFSENLKQMRKKKGWSQEELAEIMDVSRQSVSKWESGESYPEVEKLLILSEKLNISLDSLFSKEINGNVNTISTITIFSPNENTVLNCCKVTTSKKFKGGKNVPKYALFGVSNGGSSFWGEPATFLGWYKDIASISKETEEIAKAISNNVLFYELKYSSKVKRKWLKISIIE